MSVISNKQEPGDLYADVMLVIRQRLDSIEWARSAPLGDFARAEFAAFNGRKIVEAIAFGCLVAVEHGLGMVPRDAQKQWKADTIFKRLNAKNIHVLPNPSFVRWATDEERANFNVEVSIEGEPTKCLTHADLIAIYERLHGWAHELNPYTYSGVADYVREHGAQLWDDLSRIRTMMASHIISIRGRAFYCTLWDSDGQTRVRDLSKKAE